MAPNDTAQECGEPAPPRAADADANSVAETVHINPGIGPPPVRPPNTYTKINSIREGPVFIQASEIGTALTHWKKKVEAVNHRIGLLSDTIDSLTNSFSRLDDPKGSVISNLLTRSVNDTIAIETELAEFSSHNTTINMNAAEMLANEISAKMRALDIIKKAIESKIASDSLPTSRNSSSSRSGSTRNNVDSMKPSTLVYNTATLVQVSDHLTSVQDWMLNMYPDGETVDMYKSNLNSTLDKDFHQNKEV